MYHAKSESAEGYIMRQMGFMSLFLRSFPRLDAASSSRMLLFDNRLRIDQHHGVFNDTTF
jgi:hypothetical protein